MPSAAKSFRFGVFELDVVAGELRKSGIRLKLQEQPFQVLLIMLERPGQLISRDELRKTLWKSDTFVDFDHSLNTIINKLREALGDSATSPRYIETLAKRGYRFLAPVEALSGGAETPPSVAKSPAAISTSFLTHPDELPFMPSGPVRILFVLIQLMYLSFYITALARLSAIQELLDGKFGSADWVTIVLVVSAAVGIPLRLYLLSYVSFDVKDLSRKFLPMFIPTFILDELWALSPFLLAPRIGIGLSLAATAGLVYVPFAERTLVLMRDRSKPA
ncbi:MAG: winged helix-turn-helix domain-containing protein [Acidobacteriaceae bacterium]|nr:winged helix-turn-helix domain-containing protein [Acidobacteriaceae bacterium]